MQNIPFEVEEHQFPVLTEYATFRRDSEGAGKYRGRLYRLPVRTDLGLLYHRLDLLEQARGGEMVDEEAIALVSGDPAGRRVRLHEVSLLLQHCHLVADRGRRDVHTGRAGDVAGANGLGRLDVLLHHSAQDRRLAFVEHVRHRVIRGSLPPQATEMAARRRNDSARSTAWSTIGGPIRGHSSIHCWAYSPLGSNLSACRVGFMMRW